MKLQQETTIREYRLRFEQFFVNFTDMSDATLESKFVCGLKEKIQREIRKLNSMDLEGKMLMAQVIKNDKVVQLKRIHGTSKNPSMSNKTLGNGSVNQTGSKRIDRVATSRTITTNPSHSSLLPLTILM